MAISRILMAIIVFKYFTQTCRTHTCLVVRVVHWGQFYYPQDVPIDNSGVVYVTDKGNHRVQFFSADGQFISTFGSKRSQHGQLFYPLGICVDSANTVYVADDNHRVSVYTSSGQFIKCFGAKGRGEGELNGPEGVAIDNTAGALYVCDTNNHRIVVY